MKAEEKIREASKQITGAVMAVIRRVVDDGGEELKANISDVLTPLVNVAETLKTMEVPPEPRSTVENGAILVDATWDGESGSQIWMIPVDVTNQIVTDPDFDFGGPVNLGNDRLTVETDVQGRIEKYIKKHWGGWACGCSHDCCGCVIMGEGMLISNPRLWDWQPQLFEVSGSRNV